MLLQALHVETEMKNLIVNFK